MVPIEIALPMVLSGTSIPEVDTAVGEVAWSAGTAPVLGARVVYDRSVWECVKARAATAVTPPNDPTTWLRAGPSNRWAVFDDYGNTKSRSTGSITYVLQPGFFNGIRLDAIEATTYSIVLKSEPGGTVLRSWSGDLYDDASGFYELLYGPPLARQQLSLLTQLSFDDVPISPTMELTITLTTAPGVPVALGTIKVGDWRSLLGEGRFGGVQYGAEAERKSYTFREYFPDGTYRTIKRPASRNVRCSIVIDADQAMYADALLGQIIDTAVPFEATGLARYGYLNTLGFVSGSMRADTFGTTTLNLTVQGNI